MLETKRKCCINCSAELEATEMGMATMAMTLTEIPIGNPSQAAFYTLSCNSRVRSPLSPATAQLVPVHHALAAIFNFETVDKVLKVSGMTSNEDTSIPNPLRDFHSSASVVPICFVCYLVLSDLYNVYTEFNQLRKSSSFLGSKLMELENHLKATKINSNKNQQHQTMSMDRNHSVSGRGTAAANSSQNQRQNQNQCQRQCQSNNDVNVNDNVNSCNVISDETDIIVPDEITSDLPLFLQNQDHSVHVEVNSNSNLNTETVHPEVVKLETFSMMEMENTGEVIEDEEDEQNSSLSLGDPLATQSQMYSSIDDFDDNDNEPDTEKGTPMEDFLVPDFLLTSSSSSSNNLDGNQASESQSQNQSQNTNINASTTTNSPKDSSKPTVKKRKRINLREIAWATEPETDNEDILGLGIGGESNQQLPQELPKTDLKTCPCGGPHPPFQCDGTVCGHCNKTFRTKYTLRRHIIVSVLNITPFKCHFPHCSYQAGQKCDLVKHIQSTTHKKRNARNFGVWAPTPAPSNLIDPTIEAPNQNANTTPRAPPPHPMDFDHTLPHPTSTSNPQSPT